MANDRNSGEQLPDLGAFEWPADGLEEVRTCPVCGSTGRTELYRGLTDRVFFCAPGKWDMYRCEGCRSAYLDPRPKENVIHRAYSRYFTHAAGGGANDIARLSRVRRIRRSMANGYRNWRYGTRLEPATKLGVPSAFLFARHRESLDADMRLIPRLRPGGRLLDVGAGNGQYLLKARSAGWQVVGVEPDPEACAIAGKAGLDVRMGGIECLSSERDAYDVITVNHVIEHVHDPRGLVKSAFLLLRAGGVLCLETPNIDSRTGERFGGNWYSLDVPRHLVIFNWQSLEMILADAGFKCVRKFARSDHYANVIAKSRSIARGRDPETEHTALLRDHARAFLGRLRSKASIRGSDFITIVARKP